MNWTSIRPVYIYGPLNYNPVEEWFFHRLKAGRPIPIPNSGIQITQLGHVKVSPSLPLSLSLNYYLLQHDELHSLIIRSLGTKTRFQDLATAFIKVLGNPKASKEVFNISGDKYVTFDGLARACAKVQSLTKYT